MRIRTKKWSRPYLVKNSDKYLSKDNIEEELLKNALEHERIFLEIGTGKGDFIVKLAKENPDIFFIGVEKNVTVAAIALRKVINEELDNVLIAIYDIEKLFPSLEDGKFERIYLNFSDPWPKKRHEKRRLTYPTFIKEYYRLLKDDGKVCLKTDNLNFFTYSLGNFRTYKWKIPYTSYTYNGKAELDAPTEYEINFRKDGIKIKRFIAQKGEATYVD